MTIAELDNNGVPIAVSLTAVAVLARVDEMWPEIVPGFLGEFRTLAAESLSLRYWLLTRLNAEGDPPDEVFEILPWELLERAAAAVGAGLEPGGELGELVEIRHWLTPAVRGLSASLEQLDHGLRTGDSAIARLGATALLNSLSDVPISRMPPGPKAGLRALVGRLGEVDPLYRHAARFLTAALADDDEVPRLRAELNPVMEGAAGVDEVRERVEELGDDNQHIELVTNRAGRVLVTAQVTGENADDSPLAEQPALFLPVRLTPRNHERVLRFWLALEPEDDRLIGSLDIVLPDGNSRFDGDDVPVGADELAYHRPEELLPSLYASTALTFDRWREIADELPAAHPVRLAADAFEAAQ